MSSTSDSPIIEAPLAVRASLKALRREYARCLNRHGELFHELMVTRAEEKKSFGWHMRNAFKNAYHDKFKPSWEKWHSQSDGDFFGRFSGEGDGFPAFNRLAESTQLVLKEVQPLLNNSGLNGWIEVLYLMAYLYPTPLLRCSSEIWNAEDIADWTDEELEEYGFDEELHSYFPRYPDHYVLRHNIFVSSIAAIDIILDREKALLVGTYAGDFPVAFAAPHQRAKADGSEPAINEMKRSIPERTNNPVQEFRFDGVWHMRFTTRAETETGTFPEVLGLRVYKLLLDQPGKHLQPDVLLKDSQQVGTVVESGDSPDSVLGKEGLDAVRAELVRIQREIDDTADPDKQQDLKEQQADLLRFERVNVGIRGGIRTIDTLSQRRTKRIHGQLIRARQQISMHMPKFAKYLERTVQAIEGDFVYHPIIEL